MDFVCTGQTVSMQSSKRRGGCGWGLGVVRLGLITQCNCIFMIFVYWLWTWRLSALQDFVLFVFALSRCTDPKYTPPVTIIHRTHTYTHLLGHTLLIEARVFPPACKASSCSTYTHSFPSPPSISSPPTGPQGLELSLRLSRTFPSACCLFESLLSIYESLCLSFCVSIYWSIYLRVSSPFPLSQACSPKGEREGKRQLQLRARSQNLLHLDFITNKPARRRRIIIKGKNERKSGVQGLVI